MYPTDLEGIEDFVDQPKIMCRDGSAIISPLGKDIFLDNLSRKMLYYVYENICGW